MNQEGKWVAETAREELKLAVDRRSGPIEFSIDANEDELDLEFEVPCYSYGGSTTNYHMLSLSREEAVKLARWILVHAGEGEINLPPAGNPEAFMKLVQLLRPLVELAQCKGYSEQDLMDAASDACP